MKKLLPLIAILAVAGLGCGRATPPAANTVTTNGAETSNAPANPIVNKKYDSCLLFTKVDAEAVLGMKVNDPLHSGAATEDQATIVSSCSYATNAELPVDVKVASVLIRKAADATEAVRVYEEARSQSKGLSGVDPMDVQNLGDRAYWAGGALSQLNVLKGDAWFIVNIQDTKSKTLQQQATEAVRRALDKQGKM
ncbi:hypothetical protein M0Q28_01855 [Patescibacteria group bacterium]|jgi:hypothetical protein|nr:hypothetical protein [Patescibacteria group bacterium]